jgi:hypothetical protein
MAEADRLARALRELAELKTEVAELRAQQGADRSPFPEPGVDAFLSHFVIAFELDQKGERQLVPVTLDPAVQTVARSQAFRYGGRAQRHKAEFALPVEAALPDVISEEDFLVRPDGFFTPGREHVWLQILNLDARGDTPFGPVRIVLGTTLRSTHENAFLPSLGVAQSYGKQGFPARLFFSPIAVIETELGAFRTRPKVLEAPRVVGFPPLGGPVGIREAVPLDRVEDLDGPFVRPGREPAAFIVGLDHPIDAALHLEGDPAFSAVEQRIAAGT